MGDDDCRPLLAAKIPVFTIHSVTQDTFPILRTERDSLQAINLECYYTHRLAATYLGYLDSTCLF